MRGGVSIYGFSVRDQVFSYTPCEAFALEPFIYSYTVNCQGASTVYQQALGSNQTPLRALQAMPYFFDM